MRTDNEIIKKVYMAQRKSPCKGYWVNLLDEDLKYFNIDFNKETAGYMTSEHFIAMVKRRVKDSFKSRIFILFCCIITCQVKQESRRKMRFERIILQVKINTGGTTYSLL